MNPDRSATEFKFRGAHAPRVLALAPRQRELFPKPPQGSEVRCGEAPQPAREGAYAPQIADPAVADFQVTAH